MAPLAVGVLVALAAVLAEATVVVLAVVTVLAVEWLPGNENSCYRQQPQS